MVDNKFSWKHIEFKKYVRHIRMSHTDLEL